MFCKIFANVHFQLSTMIIGYYRMEKMDKPSIFYDLDSM
jgi:hypothetical protein